MNTIICPRDNLVGFVQEGDATIVLRNPSTGARITIPLASVLSQHPDCSVVIADSEDDGAEKLAKARERSVTFDFALMLFDKDLPISVRKNAVEVLSEQLYKSENRNYLLDIVLATPLPATADVDGALEATTDSKLVFDLVKLIKDSAPRAKLASDAWLATRSHHLIGPGDQERVHSSFIGAGVFRCMVEEGKTQAGVEIILEKFVVLLRNVVDARIIRDFANEYKRTLPLGKASRPKTATPWAAASARQSKPAEMDSVQDKVANEVRKRTIEKVGQNRVGSWIPDSAKWIYSHGVIGGAAGVLADSEGIALAGAIGSVGALLAAKAVPEFFSLDPMRRLLNNQKVVQILQKKVSEDLEFSFLDSQSTVDVTLSAMREFLVTAAIQDPEIGTFDRRIRRGYKWMLRTCVKNDPEYQRCLRELAGFCQKFGPIKIATAAVCAAIVAMLNELSAEYRDNPGVSFTTSFYPINGRMLFESLLTKCDVHFAIGNLEALVLADSGDKLPLKIIGPLFGQRQSIYVSTRRRAGIRSGIWVFEKASTQFQYHLGIGVPRNSHENIVTDARQIPDLVENIPPGDMIIAWSPLSSVLDKRRDYAIVPQSEYTNHFLLFGNKLVFRPKEFPLDAFLTVFLCEWRRRVNGSNNLVNSLRRDHDFMTAFALGAGHEWVPEM